MGLAEGFLGKVELLATRQHHHKLLPMASITSFGFLTALLSLMVGCALWNVDAPAAEEPAVNIQQTITSALRTVDAKQAEVADSSTVAPPATPTGEASQKALRVFNATPVLPLTPLPTLPPAPTATLQPTPTLTPVPKPTATLKPTKVARFDLAKTLPWLESPPDSVHARAADAIELMQGLDTDLAAAAATMSWVADGITYEEATMLSSIAEISSIDLIAGKRLVDMRWIVDGSDGGKALWELVGVAYHDPQAAQAAADYANNQAGNLGGYLAAALQMISIRPDAISEVTGQFRFADGISDEEAVVVTLVGGFYHCDRALYEELVDNYHMKTGTASLPLAGDVNIWVLQTRPFPEDENLLSVITDTARVGEELFGVPFPTTDIILLVKYHDQNFSTSCIISAGRSGAHNGSWMILTRVSSLAVPSIPHETAHYYFSFGPTWLVEGGANFMESYVRHVTGVESLSSRRTALLAGIKSCDGLGKYTDYISTKEAHYRFPSGCDYLLGENLLFNILDAIGIEAMSSALGELYQMHQMRYGTRIDDIAVHEVFLKHTPADKRDALAAVYQRFHGGAFAFPEDDFPDEHGDTLARAAPIAPGETMDAALNYMFDVDYFSFQASAGQKYSIEINLTALEHMDFKLYNPDGIILDVFDVNEEGQYDNTYVHDYTIYNHSGGNLVSLDWDATISGMHYMVASAGYADRGAYSLTVSLAETD